MGLIHEIDYGTPLSRAVETVMLTIDGTIAALMVLGDPLVLVVAERNLQSILRQSRMKPTNP